MRLIYFLTFSLLVGLSTAGICPPAESIAPCTCEDHYGPFNMYCYHVSTDQQLREIFHNVDYPDTSFYKITIESGFYESLGADLFGQLSADTVYIKNHHNLKSVDPNIFRGPISTRLRVINFSFNEQLKDVDLRPLETLERMDVMFTIISNNATTIIPPSVPIGLYDLNIGRNDFPEINKDIFRNMPHLKYLYLHECGLSSIEADAFMSLTALTELQLHQNKLGPILRPGSLELSSSVGSITLDNNHISEVLPGAISGFSPDAYISLGSNDMTSFPEETFRPILERLLVGGGLLEMRSMLDLPCDCSVVWLFLNPELLDTLRWYYCNGDPYTEITDIDGEALIAECT